MACVLYVLSSFLLSLLNRVGVAPGNTELFNNFTSIQVCVYRRKQYFTYRPTVYRRLGNSVQILFLAFRRLWAYGRQQSCSSCGQLGYDCEFKNCSAVRKRIRMPRAIISIVRNFFDICDFDKKGYKKVFLDCLESPGPTAYDTFGNLQVLSVPGQQPRERVSKRHRYMILLSSNK